MKYLAYYLIGVAVVVWLLAAPYWEAFGTLNGYFGR